MPQRGPRVGAVAQVILAVLSLVLGGVLKGATGAGAPVVAVPIIAMLYDVPLAVTLLAIPNVVTNVWQGWAFRHARLPDSFLFAFAGAGALGAAVGTVMLANLSSDALLLMVALAVFAYIGFRLLRPDWLLAQALGRRLAGPVGFLAGILQGASGVSAPVSITFLNAMRLERPTFIASISVFFLAMGVVQVPMLAAYGFLTPARALVSLGALAVLLASMPLGAWLARHVSRAVFDRVILALLAVIALRLVYGSLT